MGFFFTDSGHNTSPTLITPLRDSVGGGAAVCLEPWHSRFASPAGETLKDFSSLNRANFGELKGHRRLIDSVHFSFLGKVERKLEIYPERFRDPDQYLANSALLLLSTGWSSAKKYAHCCMPGAVNQSGACRLHKYCPYCSWYVGNRIQKALVPAFDSGNWFWLTGSWKGNLGFTGTNSAFDWVAYWEAYKAVLTTLVRDGLARGAYWAEELAINSLCPIRVLPHVHAIVDADDISEEDLIALEISVRKEVAKAMGPDHLQPDIQLKPITDDVGLYRCLRYMFKPIDVVTPYRHAWSSGCAQNRMNAAQINNETTELVLGFSQATQDRTKMTGRGTLFSRDGRFIGIAKADQKKYASILKKVAMEVAEQISSQAEEEMALAA